MDKILDFIKKEKEISKICTKLEISEAELLGMIELLKRQGHNLNVYNDNGIYKVDILNNVIIPQENIIELDQKSKKIKIGALGDTHFCTKYEQLTLVNRAYQDFNDRKIKTVLHGGDMVDGDYRNRPDHIYDLHKIGATQQADYVSEMYPEVEGIITYFIQGSHDATHIKNGGADIGKMISNNRPDMINLGVGKAHFILNKCDIEMLHPGGGSSYAYSYKPQKIIDSLRGGEKPNILLIHHFHKNMYMMYRNIHCLLVPSLEATTPFMTANALINDIGYDILEFEVDNQGNVIRFKVEHIPFYKTIENDYKHCKHLEIKGRQKIKKVV